MTAIAYPLLVLALTGLSGQGRPRRLRSSLRHGAVRASRRSRGGPLEPPTPHDRGSRGASTRNRDARRARPPRRHRLLGDSRRRVRGGRRRRGVRRGAVRRAARGRSDSAAAGGRRGRHRSGSGDQRRQPRARRRVVRAVACSSVSRARGAVRVLGVRAAPDAHAISGRTRGRSLSGARTARRGVPLPVGSRVPANVRACSSASRTSSGLVSCSRSSSSARTRG